LVAPPVPLLANILAQNCVTKDVKRNSTKGINARREWWSYTPADSTDKNKAMDLLSLSEYQ